MIKKYLVLLLLVMIVSCSKKHLPQTDKASNPTTKKPIIPKGPWPKTLSVDDRIATKAVDGRLYFDLDGKRYWKNYNDGKYYLFSKSMYNNPAFKLH